MSRPRAVEQILVMWRLVQHVVAAGGRAPVSEVAAALGIAEREVVRYVERAALLGVPDFQPDCLLECHVEDGCVVVWNPLLFGRPPRLSVAEGFAVAAAARALLALPGADPDGALALALAKLERVLGDTRGLAVDVAVPPYLEAVRRAAEEGRRLRVRYYSAWRDQESERRLEPHVVYEWGGRFYVDAYSPETGDVRHYRVDRIRELTDTGERFEPVRAEPPVSPFDPPPDAQAVVVEAPAATARWVTETYDCDWEARGDRLAITLTVVGRPWLERLLLRLGPEARVVSPPELAGVGAEAASRVLARYDEVPAAGG